MHVFGAENVDLGLPVLKRTENSMGKHAILSLRGFAYSCQRLAIAVNFERDHS